MSESKPSPVNPEDLYGDDQFFTAKDMAEELGDWVKKYELCFGHHELFQNIKRLQRMLERQLDGEGLILNL